MCLGPPQSLTNPRGSGQCASLDIASDFSEKHLVALAGLYAARMTHPLACPHDSSSYPGHTNFLVLALKTAL